MIKAEWTNKDSLDLQPTCNQLATDTISRQAAIDKIEITSFDDYGDYMRVRELIEQLPSAQPERKRGEWTNDNGCQFCGFQPWFERDIHTLSFCPNCGADMRGEQDE